MGSQSGDLDRALLGGAPERVGRFEFRYDSGAWTWSDTVARMHGYQPGEAEPTTELVLSHKHPDDLARVKGLLNQSVAPFSGRHRISTTTGEIRNVVVVGDPVTDADGQVVATRGFYIDITESSNAELQQSVSDRVQVIVSHREVIDQAKGMLMAIYQLSADAAFAVLRWRSQETQHQAGDSRRKTGKRAGPRAQCHPGDASTNRPLPAEPYAARHSLGHARQARLPHGHRDLRL